MGLRSARPDAAIVPGEAAAAVSAGAALCRTPWLAASLLAPALLLAIVLVDPLREFMSQDDGWAYARSVEHLLRTGEYRLDAWSAANMPVQIYLAAALAEVFGYSLSLLRISTLVLLVAGLAAFCALLRELGTRPLPAAVLALGLFASPLVLMLGFTFMSDVQFMSWLIIALWLYLRGLRRGSGSAIVLGSLAAACAIGTRQFGIAIIAGLVLAWLLPKAPRRPPLHRLLLAAAVPLAVCVWQLRAGFAEPNFTQAVRLHEQAAFLAQPALVLAREIGWRIAILVQYLGLSMLPLFPLLLALSVRELREPAVADRGRAAGRHRYRPLLTTVLLFAGLVGVSLVKSPITARENAGRVLPLEWMLPNAFWDHLSVMRGLALAGLVGALLLIFVGLRAMPGWSAIREMPTQKLLPAAVGLCLFALHLGYVQLNDTYLVALLPFALLIPAAMLRRTDAPRRSLAASVVCSAAAIVLLSLWMRGDYNGQQAQWQAADKLLAGGTDRRCIGGPRHWSEYHGAFDDWLAASHSSFDRSRREASLLADVRLHEPFYDWLGERSRDATYRVSSARDLTVPPGWRLSDELQYPNAFFASRTIRTLARTGGGPIGPAACEAAK